jgi:hypothetical protein
VTAGIEHKQRCQKPDERAPGDITGVVQTHKDASDSDERRAGEKECPYPAPADQGHRDRDCESGYGMVTGKRGLVRGRDEKERLRGVGEERSFPDP